MTDYIKTDNCINNKIELIKLLVFLFKIVTVYLIALDDFINNIILK